MTFSRPVSVSDPHSVVSLSTGRHRSTQEPYNLPVLVCDLYCQSVMSRWQPYTSNNLNSSSDAPRSMYMSLYLDHIRSQPQYLQARTQLCCQSQPFTSTYAGPLIIHSAHTVRAVSAELTAAHSAYICWPFRCVLSLTFPRRFSPMSQNTHSFQSQRCKALRVYLGDITAITKDTSRCATQFKVSTNGFLSSRVAFDAFQAMGEGCFDKAFPETSSEWHIFALCHSLAAQDLLNSS